MKRIAVLTAIVILCVVSVLMLRSYAKQEVKNIVIEINYGDVRSSRTIEVPSVKGRTALEALQTVATVETHPISGYVVVTSIDGVKGERGDMAWYYTVDGKSADKVAYSKVLDDTSHVKWGYKKDVCSGKVDKVHMKWEYKKDICSKKVDKI